MSHQHACHQHAYTSRIEKEVKDLRARGFVVFYKSRNEGGAVRLGAKGAQMRDRG